VLRCCVGAQVLAVDKAGNAGNASSVYTFAVDDTLPITPGQGQAVSVAAVRRTWPLNRGVLGIIIGELGAAACCRGVYPKGRAAGGDCP
jgi:hypothetical protein